MAVFTLQSVRDNLRVKDGRRVFYLGEADRLTPMAQQWLQDEKIAVLPASEAKVFTYETPDGAHFDQKPEHMTHLQAHLLVRKDHPRIRFRGMVDQLEAQILLVLRRTDVRQSLKEKLQEILDAVRTMMRCDVMEQPFPVTRLCGLSWEDIRSHSHYPQKYYDQPHFMPTSNDSELLLQLNLIRTVARQTEIVGYEAFHDREGLVTRTDIMQFLNRLSSMIWILMIQIKKEENGGTQRGGFD